MQHSDKVFEDLAAGVERSSEDLLKATMTLLSPKTKKERQESAEELMDALAESAYHYARHKQEGRESHIKRDELVIASQHLSKLLKHDIHAEAFIKVFGNSEKISEQHVVKHKEKIKEVDEIASKGAQEFHYGVMDLFDKHSSNPSKKIDKEAIMKFAQENKERITKNILSSATKSADPKKQQLKAEESAESMAAKKFAKLVKKFSIDESSMKHNSTPINLIVSGRER